MMAQEKVKQKMRFIEVSLVMIAVSLLIISPAWADSPPPVTTLKLYFERDHIPVNETVKFTVNCSAYDNPEVNPRHVINELGDIFSYSAICPSYGCFDRMYQYLDYAHLTSCDISGELDGKQFTILNAQNLFSCSKGKQNTQSCDLRINISSGNITATGTHATNITQTPGTGVVIMETPTVKPVETMGIFDDFICFLKNLFGGTC